jgi:glycosyltransferase involved in cell wall biosynthesis
MTQLNSIKLTVITAVYNGEKFIEGCIQSVIQQASSSAENLVEHLIIDGASTDRTVEIIQQYAAKYPHIRWISEKDQGQSDAMNRGIKLAQGEIISFLNVDDFYEPGALGQVIEMFETLPQPSFLAGNCRLWNSQRTEYQLNQPKRLALADLLMGWNVNPFPYNPAAYFYHRSIHDQVGMYSVEEHYAMDLDFILRAVQVAHLKYVDQVLGNFYFHEDCKTSQDNQSNSGYDRVQAMMRRYRKQLPWAKRLYVTAIYEYHENPQLGKLRGLGYRISPLLNYFSGLTQTPVLNPK